MLMAIEIASTPENIVIFSLPGTENIKISTNTMLLQHFPHAHREHQN